MATTLKAGRPPKLENPRRVIAALPEGMIARLDVAAQAARVTRSEAIRWAVEEWLATRTRPTRKE